MRMTQRLSHGDNQEQDILPRIRYGSGSVCIGLDVGSGKSSHVVNVYLSRKDLIDLLYASEAASQAGAEASARHNAQVGGW